MSESLLLPDNLDELLGMPSEWFAFLYPEVWAKIRQAIIDLRTFRQALSCYVALPTAQEAAMITNLLRINAMLSDATS